MAEDTAQDLERDWANAKAHPLYPAGFNSILPGIIMGGPGGGYDGRLNMITNPGTTPNYCSVEYNICSRSLLVRGKSGTA